jgi:hypothetical protein
MLAQPNSESELEKVLESALGFAPPGRGEQAIIEHLGAFVDYFTNSPKSKSRKDGISCLQTWMANCRGTWAQEIINSKRIENLNGNGKQNPGIGALAKEVEMMLEEVSN